MKKKVRKPKIAHDPYKLRKRKHNLIQQKPQWVHYRMDKPFESFIITTACEKTARRVARTINSNKVTCPRCIEIMKQTMWYCEIHGFINGEEVNFEETCDYCLKDKSND